MNNFRIYKIDDEGLGRDNHEETREIDGETLHIGVKYKKEVKDTKGPSFRKYNLVYEDFESFERMNIDRGEIKTTNEFVLNIGSDYELDLIENEELNISVRTEKNKVARYADFLLTSDGYLLIEQTNGLEAENIISTVVGTDLKTVEIDVESVQQSFAIKKQLGAGFESKEKRRPQVEIQGHGIEDHYEVSRYRRKSELMKTLFEVEYRGENATLKITNDGCVRIYSPFNYPYKTAVKMVSEKIIPNSLVQNKL